MPRMWLTPGKASGRKNVAPRLLEKECYEGEFQPYRKTDYKPMMGGGGLVVKTECYLHHATSSGEALSNEEEVVTRFCGL